jgi:hypothetical protein
MSDTPLLARQREQVIAEVQQSSDNLIFIIIYDTQSVSDVVKILTGQDVPPDELKGRIARFRLSNYLPTATGETLVDRLKEVILTSDWVILHTGCSICPEIVLEFFQYLSEKRFAKPRLIVVGEETDVRYGDERMKKLFSLGHLVNLVAKEI